MIRAVVVQLLEISEDLPWPWRLVVVVGVPLSAWLFLSRLGLMLMLLGEGFVTSRRRRAGIQPGPLVHAISDGLELAGRWLRRVVMVPMFASAAAAVVVFGGSVVGVDFAEEAEFRMVDYAERVMRAE